MLKNFTMSSLHPLAEPSMLWGNGHTHETLPTNKGWRAKATCKGSPTLLCGQPGIKGCFSAQVVPALVVEGQVVGEGYIDVALYTETPEEVLQHTAKVIPLDPKYVQLTYYPGWGLDALRLVEEERRLEAEFEAHSR